jgi:hypothetical protein
MSPERRARVEKRVAETLEKMALHEPHQAAYSFKRIKIALNVQHVASRPEDI